MCRRVGELTTLVYCPKAKIHWKWHEQHFCANRPTPPGSGSPALHLSDRVRLARRMLPSELGLPLLGQRGPHSNWRGCAGQLGLIIALLALMWFVRLYLHYCSQWLFLQAIAVPVNKWVCSLWYCHECMSTHAEHFTGCWILQRGGQTHILLGKHAQTHAWRVIVVNCY